MECVCVPFRAWMGKTKDLSAFERGMVVGARRTGWKVCQELLRCCVFHAQQFPECIKNGPPPKGHPANLTQLLQALESTWVNIPVERFQHLVESMSPYNLGCSEGKGGCNSILESVPNVLYSQCTWFAYTHTPYHRPTLIVTTRVINKVDL